MNLVIQEVEDDLATIADEPLIRDPTKGKVDVSSSYRLTPSPAHSSSSSSFESEDSDQEDKDFKQVIQMLYGIGFLSWKREFVGLNDLWGHPWNRWKLLFSRRQGVKDLPSAYAAADHLVDFRVVGGPDSEKKKSKDGGKDKGKNGKYGKDGKSKFKKAKDAASGSKPKESQPEIDRSRKGCFICGGDHRMRDCPKRSKLNALMAEDDDSGKDVAPSRVNPLQLLSAIQRKSPNHKGLMYVKISVNGKVVMAMIDTGATHNFVAEREI
ncbi:hypothetical protein BUALT_Bualt13G0104300 [Buddleja alternifolia]|uniref:Uncharacterized protein n=1 Tax=Buddleja alternifolia TaxID=168488 RepID=A0AAV6WXB8_9LAMI|nr:hypothetical protein BUALT_Bualt13G0104300 [Buddleja alternifolia]